ncbi:DUF2929 family protein [Lactobacillus sp. S2-2]|uniref:DUF2929 family protein n=1 Tax=Lactobacillus sp. S2-2 TaxID=2692917 RepID=UPI001F45D3B3|nr:DUF2929 family protein [Lactobacillus sp. S2-2]MCF6514996.1 DUF2929 family protein [Lactobacillus sp. S2-2]
MRTFAANLTIIFWGLIYGEILGYIGSALAQSPFNSQTALSCAIAGIVVALVGTHGIRMISKRS